MRIASLVARRLVLSVVAKSQREVARQNQTSAYCSAGRIQWRVHNACARTAKSVSTIWNTGLVRATSRVLSPFLRFSFPSVSLSILEDHRHHPRLILNPFVRLPAAKRLRNSAGRSCASPIEMYRFHYKLLMRRICLSASRCSCRCSPLSCHGHCLHRE